MPAVPEFNKKPLKIVYNPKDITKPATMKQKNYIITLCERRKLPIPNLSTLTIGEAAILLSSMTNN